MDNEDEHIELEIILVGNKRAAHIQVRVQIIPFPGYLKNRHIGLIARTFNHSIKLQCSSMTGGQQILFTGQENKCDLSNY